ncbi:MAG TPA: hypothetical protein HA303_00150, partial [Candidatus Thalassarchaeaceae archaeon]|nr:hypothetical protein [Candidatus Thalassarchaeaceae archaeon]
MSQVQTRQMGRLTAAGVLDNLDDALEMLSRLKALHFIDYTGSEDGFSLGTPSDKSEQIGRDLNKVRAAVAQIEVAEPTEMTSATSVRKSLDGELPEKVDSLLSHMSRIDEIDTVVTSKSEEEATLGAISPLEIDVELLTGYSSLTSFIGTVNDVNAAKAAAANGIFIDGGDVIAVFVKNEDASETSSALQNAGFAAIQLPEGEGDADARINQLAGERVELLNERESLNSDVESWSLENGEELLCGLELLERDHDLKTSPVKVAVTDHAFVIDGWVEMDRAHDIKLALANTCIVVDVEPFVIEAGGAHHDDDHHHEPVSP